MSPGKVKYRFESEVHLGMLSIVLILLLLSVASNFVLFKARVRLQEETTAQLRAAVVVVTRALHEQDAMLFPEVLRRQLIQQHQLSSFNIVPPEPEDPSPASRAIWLAGILSELPASQAPDIVDRLLRAEPNNLMRGENSQFFMVAPVPVGQQHRLAIVAATNADLAYLQDGNRIVLWVGVGVTLLGAIGYLVLSRFIFRPFRRIKEQAALGGHDLGEIDHEADVVVEEYKRVIRELWAQEAELIQLNAAIQNRADSLEQYNDYLLSSIDSGIISLEKDGTIKAINQAAAKMLRLSTNAVGSEFTEAFPESTHISQAIRLALKGAVQSGYREINYQLPDGSDLVLGVAVSAVRDTIGRMLGISILINDLTELNDLRAQVEQKNRLAALGEMSAGLAHQIRNSVGAIGGFGNLIKRRFVRENQSTELVESLLKETREAEELVSKFLLFARPLDLQPQSMSLRELIQELKQAYKAREDCMHIQCELQGDDIIIEADPLLLKQVLGNLVDNAIIAYEGRPGRVEVSLATQEQTAIVRVRDFGCGIPPDRLDKVFTPFYSSRPSGTGLGLSLASRIVTLHGGTLSVESILGKGTIVTINLPLAVSTPQSSL